MKFCSYDAGTVGVVVEDRVFPIGDALVKNGFLRAEPSMIAVIDILARDPDAWRCVENQVKSGPSVPLGSVKLLPPVSNPPSLWAAAANYMDHRKEMEAKTGRQERPVRDKDELMAEFFLKPSSSIIGPGDTIVLPKISKDVDFECELCAVIGKRARYVREDQALDYVFGYTICWDISQREPWGRGKSNTRNIRKGFDTFTGLGPWIVTKDEIENPQDLYIQVEQNGHLVMNAYTGDMICTLRDHIRFLTHALTLRPGDLITTGTPAGVRKLADGDHLKGRISKIGEMELFVRAEQ
ncbi:MAG TPA: fumarylacetoacetate hydrolase family protein [Candidatus Acidoferrales bacterium]|nr:fumarylacetoacetate hydrolase family protein [Candidatus Acidoferrales bacterium]